MGSIADNLPSGSIVMWGKSIAEIPLGWVLCDGTNGTPDMRNRSPIGADADVAGVPNTTVTGSATQTGGEATHTITITEMPAHTHDFTLYSTGGGNLVERSQNAGPTFTQTTSSTGGGAAHNNMHPYFALPFIMKT